MPKAKKQKAKKQKKCHHCTLKCIVTRSGKIVCGHPGKFKKMRTRKQKKCASRKIAKMVGEWKKGRWKSREQAIAVGLSKARASC